MSNNNNPMREYIALGGTLYRACSVGRYTEVKDLLGGNWIEVFSTSSDNLLDCLSYTDQKNTALHAACMSGHVPIINLLYKAGMNLSVRNVLYETPLHTAAQFNNYQAIEFLHSLGADVDVVNCSHATPLHVATINACAEARRRELARAQGKTNSPGVSHQRQTLRSLLCLGARIRGMFDGMTPLDMACSFQNMPIVDELLNGKDFWQVEGNVETLLRILNTSYIQPSCRVSTVLKLLAYTPEPAKRFRLLALVLMCAQVHRQDIYVTTRKIKVVLSASNKLLAGGLDSLLNSAVALENVDIVKAIIACGADVNCLTFDGLPLLTASCGKKSMEIVELLIERGAMVNARCHLTPLHRATLYERTDIMQLLLDKGADPNRREVQLGLTPLHFAHYNGRMDHVRLLRSYGADPTLTDILGQRPSDVPSPCRRTVISALSDIELKTIKAFQFADEGLTQTVDRPYDVKTRYNWCPNLMAQLGLLQNVLQATSVSSNNSKQQQQLAATTISGNNSE